MFYLLRIGDVVSGAIPRSIHEQLCTHKEYVYGK